MQVILDTGSQRLYITNWANKLFLTPESRLCLTFDSKKEDPKNYEVVQVGMKMNDGSNKELTLFAVPFWYEPLAAQLIVLYPGLLTPEFVTFITNVGEGLVKLITCNDVSGHYVDVWRCGIFLLNSCKVAF